MSLVWKPTQGMSLAQERRRSLGQAFSTSRYQSGDIRDFDIEALSTTAICYLSTIFCLNRAEKKPVSNEH